MSREDRAGIVNDLTREVRKFIAGTILFNQTVAESLGMNSTDLQCLHVLHLYGAATPGELARSCGLTTGGMTVVLDRLEKAGYVRREPNPNDRRSTIVRHVASRARKLEAHYRSKSALLARVLEGYSDAELRLILDFFARTNAPGEHGAD